MKIREQKELKVSKALFKRRVPAFHGKLAEPVQLRRPTDLLEDPLETRKEAVAKLYEKLPELATWYGVAPDKHGRIDWRTVCLRLAHDLGVPGFQIEEPPPIRRARGRPRATTENHWQLLYDVAEIRQGTGAKLSVLGACRALTKRRSSWWRKHPPSLVSRHAEMRARFRRKFGFEFGSAEHAADHDRYQKWLEGQPSLI